MHTFIILLANGINISGKPDETYGESENQSDPFFDKILLKGIDDLNLSIRTRNCLNNANMKTVADIVRSKERELLRIKNFGRKSILEIGELLHSMGLRFGMKLDIATLKIYGMKSE
jgi:DNA-directed RNA polymerase subunit alpha